MALQISQDIADMFGPYFRATSLPIPYLSVLCMWLSAKLRRSLLILSSYFVFGDQATLLHSWHSTCSVTTTCWISPLDRHWKSSWDRKYKEYTSAYRKVNIGFVGRRSRACWKKKEADSPKTDAVDLVVCHYRCVEPSVNFMWTWSYFVLFFNSNIVIYMALTLTLWCGWEIPLPGRRSKGCKHRIGWLCHFISLHARVDGIIDVTSVRTKVQ